MSNKDGMELTKSSHKTRTNTHTHTYTATSTPHHTHTHKVDGKLGKMVRKKILILVSVQVTINDIKRSPIIERKGTPNHDTTTTKRQTLIDVNVSRSLSRTPVHPFPAVAEL